MKPIMQKGYRNRTNRSSHTGFTLVDLLVVLMVIGMVFLTLLPAFSRAKPKSQTARCASNMRMWGWATTMYLADNTDHVPFYSRQFGDLTSYHWSLALTPYVAKSSQAGEVFESPLPVGSTSADMFTNEVRKCPAGSYNPPPHYTGTWNPKNWNCWIGANYGTYAPTLNGPFYYERTSGGSTNPPLSISQVRKPADALMFMDTITHYVYSPVAIGYKFTLDIDGDGKLDSMSQNNSPYNNARPTVHNGGANVALLDGHIEPVSFEKLWQVNSSGNVVHSFWYLED